MVTSSTRVGAMLCDLDPFSGLKLPFAQQVMVMATDSLLVSLSGHCSRQQRPSLANVSLCLNAQKPNTELLQLHLV